MFKYFVLVLDIYGNYYWPFIKTQSPFLPSPCSIMIVRFSFLVKLYAYVSDLELQEAGALKQLNVALLYP